MVAGLRISCREHEVLAFPRQQLQHPLDGWDEAHIEHPIGFVEHQTAHAAQIDGALVRKIEQPAGGGDQQIAAAAQVQNLLFDIDAAKDDVRAKIQIFAVAARALGDLCGKFARRGQYERARRASGRRAEFLQYRQNEGGGLTRAGLRAGEYVAIGKNGGDGLALNRARRRIALFGHGAQQLGREPEISK
jgi:hypothetical protein